MIWFHPQQVFLRETHVLIDGTVDCFFSFFQFDGHLHSVHRRFQLTQSGRDNSVIIHTVYVDGWAGDIISERVIGVGSDPRAAFDDHSAYAVFCAAPGDSNRYYVYDFRSERLSTVRAIIGHPYIGKNWQPYMSGGQLYAVQEFNPVRILRLDLAAESANMIAELESGLNLRSPHDSYWAFRGGSNALEIDGSLLGFGHITQMPWDHLPFQWHLGGAGPIECLTANWHQDIRAMGYRIIDPCSFFRFKSGLYLSVVASDRDWFYGQRFATAIYRLRGEQQGLSRPVSTQGRFNHKRFPNFDTIVATELPCDIARKDELGIRHSEGETGYLAYGPGWTIDGTGAFRATVSYASDADIGSRLGIYDILVTCDDGQHILAAADLIATNQNMLQAHLDFEITNDHIGGHFEVRLASNGAPIRVFSFKISHQPT